MIGINPFNQPDVEASKVKTRALMKDGAGAAPEAPLFADNGIKLSPAIQTAGMFNPARQFPQRCPETVPFGNQAGRLLCIACLSQPSADVNRRCNKSGT